MDDAHKPTEVSSYRTQVLDNGGPSFLLPAATGFTLNMAHMQTPPLIWKLVRRKEPSSKGAFKMDWETISLLALRMTTDQECKWRIGSSLTS